MDEDTQDYINFYKCDYTFDEKKFLINYAKFLLNRLLDKFKKDSVK